MALKLPTRRADGKGADAAPAAAPAPTPPAKAQDVVGLDISSGSLAGVRVQGGLVQNASIVDISPGLLDEGEVTDPDGLAELLRDFFKANGLSKKVRLGLASPRVVIRTIELPLISDPKQIDAAVRFQAQEKIPMPLSEAVLDYQIVQHIITDDTQKMQVVLVAASRGTVDALLEAVRKAGLKPQGIDLDAFALIRVLYPGSSVDSETIAYVHYGDVVNVTLAVGKICTFTRATPKGFEQMITHLTTRANLTREHARQWCAHVGMIAPVASIEGDREIVEATRDELDVAVNTLGTDVRASIDFYTAQEGSNPVSRVLLSGPGSVVPGVADALAARIGLPVEVPPALGMIDGSSVDSVGIDHHRLTLATGLALNEAAAS